MQVCASSPAQFVEGRVGVEPLRTRHQRAEVEPVGLQAGFRFLCGVVRSPQLMQNGDFEVARLVMSAIARQRPLDQVERRVPVMAATGNPRQFEIAAVLPCRIPVGFVESVVSSS